MKTRLDYFLLIIISALLLFLLLLPLRAFAGDGDANNYLPLIFKPPSPGRLLISEVMANPAGDEPDREWIEIYNAGGTELELEDYKIGDEEMLGGDEGMLRFPPGLVIAPGEVLVIANQALPFQSTYGFMPDLEIRESDPWIPNLSKYSSWSGGSILLSNNGDDVLILGASDELVDAVSWGESSFAFNPPVPDPKESSTLERFPPDSDHDRAQDWRHQASPVPGEVTFPSPTPTSSATPTQTLTVTASQTATLTGTSTLTMTSTATASATITFTPTPSPSPTVTLTVTPSPSPTLTITASSTVTITPLSSPTPSPTFTTTPAPSPTHTATATNTIIPSPTWTSTATSTPSPSPTPTITVSSGLLLSEVVYDSTCSTDANCEWIEIYNAGSSPVDISEYKIGDEEVFGGTEGMFKFPDGTMVAAGQAITIANKAVDFYTVYGIQPDFEIYGEDASVPNMVRYSSWSTGSVQLHNDGDEVLLLNPQDEIIDALSWGTSTSFMDPAAADVAAGHSLERNPANQDTNTSQDWIDQSQPEPGAVHIQ